MSRSQGMMSFVFRSSFVASGILWGAVDCWATLSPNDSYYIVNQSPDRNFVEFQFSHTEATLGANGTSGSAGNISRGYRGDSSSNILGVHFRRTLEDNQNLWMGTQIEGRKIISNDGQTVSSVGLGDLELGYKSGAVFDLVTATWGVSGSLSPGLAQDPRLGSFDHVNSFSGYQSIAPFLGAESYVGNVAVGASTELRLYSDIRYENALGSQTLENPHRWVPKIKGFVQVPIVRNWDWGMEVAIARSNYELDQMLFGGTGNEYEALMYGQWKMEAKTAILAGISTADRKYPLPESHFDFAMILRKEM